MSKHVHLEDEKYKEPPKKEEKKEDAVWWMKGGNQMERRMKDLSDGVDGLDRAINFMRGAIGQVRIAIINSGKKTLVHFEGKMIDADTVMDQVEKVTSGLMNDFEDLVAEYKRALQTKG